MCSILPPPRAFFCWPCWAALWPLRHCTHSHLEGWDYIFNAGEPPPSKSFPSCDEDISLAFGIRIHNLLEAGSTSWGFHQTTVKRWHICHNPAGTKLRIYVFWRTGRPELCLWTHCWCGLLSPIFDRYAGIDRDMHKQMLILTDTHTHAQHTHMHLHTCMYE